MAAADRSSLARAPNLSPGPIAMLAARPALALTVQAFVAGVFRRRGEPQPWRAAAGWWMVDGSLVDLGCLAALAVLTRREGGRLSDLLGDERGHGGRDFRLDLLGAVGMLLPAVAVSAIVQRAFYGAAPPPQIAVVRLPRWAAAYSVLVWPALWATTEEMTYLGYILPRLEALTGHTGRAAALVAASWAAQHITMPLLPDRRYLAARLLTALPVTAATTALYVLRGRRLAPLIMLHWASDAATALLATSSERRDRGENYGVQQATST